MDAEREFLLEQLAASEREFLDVVDSVAAEDSGKKLGPNRWSVLECLEHVIVAEAGMRRMIENAQPGEQNPDGSFEHDRAFLSAAQNRSRKLESPEIALPTGRFSSMGEARDRFVSTRAKTVELVCGDAGDLRGKWLTHPHPAVGRIDAHTCFLLIAAHSTRHAAQIRETIQVASKKSN